jgi:hypothetical protein
MLRTKSSSWSLRDLEKMISTRRAALAKLTKRRAKAQKQLDTIDREITQFGGSGSRGSGRAKNAQSLVATLGAVLKGKESMSVGDIVDAVQARGYRSSSANFRGIVNQTLIKESQFASAGRGMYQLKK